MCSFQVPKVAKVEKQADVEKLVGKNWLEISAQSDLADGCSERGRIYTSRLIKGMRDRCAGR